MGIRGSLSVLVTACVLLSMVSVMPPVVSTSPKIIYVDGGNEGFEDGTQEHPYNTIQEGIDAASPGDTVLVAAGVYHEHIIMKSGVTIKGAGAEVTTIDGGGSGKVVTGADDSTLTGFTITGGSGHGDSGIFCSGASPTIINNIITNNRFGIVAINDSNPKIVRNFIFKNSAAIYINRNSSLLIVNNVIARNGGGIFIDHGSSPIITNNTIVYNEYSFALLNYYFAGSPTITNNIITNNLIGVGVVYLARPIVSYNDIWSNSIDYWGYGVENVKPRPSDYPISFDPSYDNIEWFNNISADPMFVDPANNDFRLREGSPCIDAGTNDAPGLPETDFDGNPRVADGDGDGVARVDIGAFEYVSAVIPATVDIDPDTLNLGSGGKWITCYIELPEGYDVADIDVSTVLLEGEVQAEARPTKIGDYDDDGIPDLMIKFNRSDVQELVEVGDEVELVVSGKCDGVPFSGSDSIRVINRGRG
jgi:parallel beta-helix repeat protein